MTQWGNVRMPQTLIEEIAEYVRTDNAKERGFTNVTQFVNSIVRYKLDEIQKQGYHIVLRNKQSNTHLDLVIRENGQSIHCKECNRSDCEHVMKATTDPDVLEVLKKNGFSLPRKSKQKKKSIVPDLITKSK